MNCNSEVSDMHEGFETLRSYGNNIHMSLHNSFLGFFLLIKCILSLSQASLTYVFSRFHRLVFKHTELKSFKFCIV